MSGAGAPRVLHDVVLLSAGPGNLELLTIKAARALETADVLLLDELVDPRITELAPRARVVRVGKRGGCRSTPQSFICRLMRRYALQGARVVRVKGGDALLFGRAGEEIAFLRDSGIHVRIINGSGLTHMRGRPGDTDAIVAFSKHYSSDPRLVEFEGFIPGQPVPVPKWMVDAPDPSVRNYVAMGSTIIKAQLPFAYLFCTLNQATIGTLDDGVTQITLPTAAAAGLPTLGSDWLWAVRAWP